MSNARLRAGHLGTVSYLDLPSGRIQARALLCDELGVTQRLKASGKTTEEARRALLARAEAVRLASGGPTLGMDSTIAEVCAVFLADKRQSGTVVGSTLDNYESTVRLVLVPTCGALLLRDLTVRRCNRVLADIKASMSLSAARKARSVPSAQRVIQRAGVRTALDRPAQVASGLCSEGDGPDDVPVRRDRVAEPPVPAHVYESVGAGLGVGGATDRAGLRRVDPDPDRDCVGGEAVAGVDGGEADALAGDRHPQRVDRCAERPASHVCRSLSASDDGEPDRGGRHARGECNRYRNRGRRLADGRSDYRMR